MIFYFLVFIIATLFSLLAENKFKFKNKKIYIILVFIAIFIPSLVAGLRSVGIGTDTKGYISYVFRNCINISSVSELIIYIKNADVEPLFIIIDFIITRFTRSVNFSYFIFQFIILLFVYLACSTFRKDKYVSLSYFLFLVLFYNRSLNMCRQSIAIAIILFTLKFVLERNLIKFLFFIILASLFHKTALVFLPVYLIFPYLNSKNKNLNKFILFIFIILFIVFYKKIIFIMNWLGIVENKYLFYISGNKSTLSDIELLIKIVLSTLIVLFNSSISKKDKNIKFLINIFIIGIITMFLGIYSAFGQRISYYFGYFIIFLIPNLINIVKRKNQKKIILIIIIVATMIYSNFCYGYLRWDETVPYKSILFY